MPGTANPRFLAKLEAQRDQLRATCETMLLEARSHGREILNEGGPHRYRHAGRPDRPR